MPIVIPGERLAGDAFYERLQEAGVSCTTDLPEGALLLRVGILNLMPAAAMARTEVDWLGRLACLRDDVYIEAAPLKFDNDRRERPGSSRESILNSYVSFSDAKKVGLDALIVTGDNLELKKHKGFSSRRRQLPFEDISYHRQLSGLVEWADENVGSTIYSCLASHFALNSLYGLRRKLRKEKAFGVFEQTVHHETQSPYVQGLRQTMYMPHSRWGETPLKVINRQLQSKRPNKLKSDDVRVLVESEEIGWGVISRNNKTRGKDGKPGTDLFLQGHPEYSLLALHAEFWRDVVAKIRTLKDVPKNFYNTEPKTEETSMEFIQDTWSGDSSQLLLNWLNQLVKTKSDQNTLAD